MLITQRPPIPTSVPVRAGAPGSLAGGRGGTPFTRPRVESRARPRGCGNLTGQGCSQLIVRLGQGSVPISAGHSNGKSGPDSGNSSSEVNAFRAGSGGPPVQNAGHGPGIPREHRPHHRVGGRGAAHLDLLCGQLAGGHAVRPGGYWTPCTASSIQESRTRRTLTTSYPAAPSMARAATWATLNTRRSKVPAWRAWSTRRTAASASWATAARSSAYAGMRRALAAASDTSAMVHTYYDSGPAHELRPPYRQSQRSARKPGRDCPHRYSPIDHPDG